jgi:hypothetical protein
MAEVRIATFNLENFDETAAGAWPSLAERLTLMRPQIVRLRANIACFQEVNSQEQPQPATVAARADRTAGWHKPRRSTTSQYPNNQQRGV